MSDIFISYSSSDRSKARALAQQLEQEGWSVWWDRIIPPGQSFSSVLEDALASARCVVVLWSRASAESDWVQTEAAEGKRRNILVPAMIEEAELPLEFKRIQAANLIDWPVASPEMEYAQFHQAISQVLNTSAPQGEAVPRRSSVSPVAEDSKRSAKKTTVAEKPKSRWFNGFATRTALLSLISGVVLLSLFKFLFPLTPVSEAITMIALLSAACGTGLNLGWSYLKKRENK
ncbi:MAG TPA: toll/interleukin-1 receptor domain-containing protein [Malonomonas sp.]